MTFFKIYEIIFLLLMGKILKNCKNLICYTVTGAVPAVLINGFFVVILKEN
jgi:hypothetical protein